MSREHDEFEQLPEGFLRRWMILHAGRLTAVEKVTGNGSAFTDEQRNQIKDAVAESLGAFVGSDAFHRGVDSRFEHNEGRKASRFLLWVGGTLGAAIIGIIVGSVATYLKLKG